MASWIVYVLECADGSLYCGITNNLAARLKVHNLGKGGKYTRSRLPVRVRHTERRATKGAALSREVAIKRLTRPEKVALIAARTARRVTTESAQLRKPRAKKP